MSNTTAPNLLTRIYRIIKMLLAKRFRLRRQRKPKDHTTIKEKQRKHRPLSSLAIALCISSYLITAFSLLLYLIPTHPARQLLGYQFYDIQGETILVQRQDFKQYKRKDPVLYQKQNTPVTTYHIGSIQNIDVANYTITLSPDMLLGKDQIIGIIRHRYPAIIKPLNQATRLLCILDTFLLLLILIQLCQTYQHMRRSD